MLNFSKHPVETYPIGVDYTKAAPSGAILVSGTWSAVDEGSGLDVSTAVFQVLPAVIDGQVAKCRILGGELDHSYRLSITANFDTGDVLHDNVYMYVIQEG